MVENRVSILVLLDVALKGPWAAIRDHDGLNVSILVLLDVALKVQNMLVITPLLLSFNPCSLGCCSERSLASMI